jgi:hypothetical protein
VAEVQIPGFSLRSLSVDKAESSRALLAPIDRSMKLRKKAQEANVSNVHCIGGWGLEAKKQGMHPFEFFVQH